MVWNKRTGTLVAGHQRLAQIDELEGTDDYNLEIDVVDLDELQEKELNILLNSRNVQGEDDDERLAQVLMELGVQGRDVRDAGIELDQAMELFSSFNMGEHTVEEPVPPEELFAPDPDALDEKPPTSSVKVTFSFHSDQQADLFQNAIGLETGRRIFDWNDIRAALDIGNE